MNTTPYIGQSTDLVLGQEFLTWLWFKSSTGAIFADAEQRPFTVTMEQRIVVQGGEGEHTETATVSGLDSELREARMGLTTGKKVTRALIRLERGPEAWQVTLKAENFSLGSLKTPTIEKDSQEKDDGEGRLLEKIALTESCLSLLDTLYALFLSLRFRPEWSEETRLIREWTQNA